MERHRSTGSEETRLQEKLRGLQRQLKRAISTLGKIRALRETIRMHEAVRDGRLAYPSAGDGGLSRLESSLEQVRSDAKQLALEYDELSLKKEEKLAASRAQRRLSIKIEEEATRDVEPAGEVDYDTDATIDELSFVEVEAENLREGDWEEFLKLDTVPKTEPLKPVNVNAAQLKVTVNEATAKPDNVADSLAECRAFVLNRTSDTTKFLSAIHDFIAALNEKYPRTKPRKSSVCIPHEYVEALIKASEAVLDRLVQSNPTLALVQPALRLHDVMGKVSQPELVEALISPMQSLNNIVSTFAETLGGMKRTYPSPTRDAVAQECFTLAVDSLTTDCSRRRLELVDAVLRALKSGFKTAIALRKLPPKTTERSTKKDAKKTKTPYDRVPKSRDKEKQTNDRWTIPWAGRVLLLSANIAAYVIATKAIGKTERFMHIVQLIGARHPIFLSLLERPRKIVLKASKKLPKARPLDLQHETQRVHEACVKALEQAKQM